MTYTQAFMRGFRRGFVGFALAFYIALCTIVVMWLALPFIVLALSAMAVYGGVKAIAVAMEAFRAIHRE